MGDERRLLPTSTYVGRVALSVRSLDREREFYRDVVGLRPLDAADQRVVLGAGDDPLLRLEHTPDRPPRGRDETGLFHTAVLFPSRAALADALYRVESHWNLDGASDHRVSEALYLSDHEGNGVELYRDRPQSEWPVGKDGSVRMTTEPLDLDSLSAEGTGADEAPPGTRIGHVHLEVSSIAAARAFYGNALGLRVRQTYGDDALFLAAGDYHHHVGVNVWRGRSEPRRGRGLEWFELVVPDESTLSAATKRLSSAGYDVSDRPDGITVTDPDGIEVRLRIED